MRRKQNSTVNRPILGPFRFQRFSEIQGGRVVCREVWPAEDVTVSSLPIGQHMLAQTSITEVPNDVGWQSSTYRSMPGYVFECHDVFIHSSAGIVCFDDTVIEDTLDHTVDFINHYRNTTNGIEIPLRAGGVTELQGTHIAVLAGGIDNYYHWTTECIGRLATVEQQLEQVTSVLMPQLTTSFQKSFLKLMNLSSDAQVRFVAPDETVRVERLILPWTVVGQYCPAPRLHAYFDRVGSKLKQFDQSQIPKRLYIDRRGSAARQLVNEEELISALVPFGITAVRLENIALTEQIRLFAEAELIIAPHGAGLTNLLYAARGCKVIELHMNTWVNACFRRIAAICNLDYDCVIGRQRPECRDAIQMNGYALTGIHAQTWEVSLTHVLGAVEQALARH